MVSQGISVLIVDDEPGVGGLIQAVLQKHGFTCWVVSDSSRAKEFLAFQRFNVLVADIRMPGGGGLELLAHVKSADPDCKVILITGSSTREYMTQALLLGAYDYIEKPLDADELVRVVSKAVAEPSSSVLYDRAAKAMELSSQAKDALLESVRALVLTVEAKDPYTRQHSGQVAHYAVNLAEALHVSPTMVEHIRVAAILHDIGKISVPDHILTKPGKLTAEEFEYIRRHPVVGAQILDNITFLKKEALLVKHHHERWDGNGYPDRLTGEESPFASRIICVADSIDAMLMARVYKSGYPAEKMLSELVRGAGTQFDPKIAGVAVEWCRANPDKLILSSSQPGPDDLSQDLFGRRVELAGVASPMSLGRHILAPGHRRP